jgi:hypothetical protein
MGMERRVVWGYMGRGTEIQGKKCAIMHGRKKIN